MARGSTIAWIILVLLLLIWAITFTIFATTSLNPFNKKTAAGSASVVLDAGTSGDRSIPLKQGILLENGSYALVWQTDGHLVVFHEVPTLGTSSVVKSSTQPYTAGTLSYNGTTKTSTLEFTGKDIPSWKTELPHASNATTATATTAATASGPVVVTWEMLSDGKMQLVDGTQKKDVELP